MSQHIEVSRRDVMTAMSVAVNDLMNALGRTAGLQALVWILDHETDGITGQVWAGHPDQDAARIGARWAAALGLLPVDPVSAGSLEWRGQIPDGMSVTVWAVTDREVYER